MPRRPTPIEREVMATAARARAGRSQRLLEMADGAPQHAFPAPLLPTRYYDEARLCWYAGAFVSAIIMAQLAFEELLRSYYRALGGAGACLRNGTPLSNCGFNELIQQARVENLITPTGSKRLHELRMMRNPYVHSRDEGQEKNYVEQSLKISVPSYIGASVEEEARRAVKTLVHWFPKLSQAIWGEDHDDEEESELESGIEFHVVEVADEPVLEPDVVARPRPRSNGAPARRHAPPAVVGAPPHALNSPSRAAHPTSRTHLAPSKPAAAIVRPTTTREQRPLAAPARIASATPRATADRRNGDRRKRPSIIPIERRSKAERRKREGR